MAAFPSERMLHQRMRDQMLRQRKEDDKRSTGCISLLLRVSLVRVQSVYDLIIGINNEELGTTRDDGEEGGKRGEIKADC